MKFLKKPEFILLFVLILISFFLRSMLFPENIFLGPEQGRDLLVARDIIENHNLTLIGPKTDIEGVFHGPLFYYLLSASFLLAHGDPFGIMIFFLLIHVFGVVFIYFLGKEVSSKRVGIISSIIFTFSFSAVSYSRWLSNPPLSIVFATLFLLFFHLGVYKKSYYLIPAAIMFALLGQVEFLNFIIFIPFVIIILLLNIRKIKLINPLILLASVFLLITFSFSTYILFDLRHESLLSKSLISALKGSSSYYASYGDVIHGLINSFSGFLRGILDLYFLPSFFALLFFTIISIFSAFYRKKGSQYFLIWILTPLIVLIFLKHDPLEHWYLALMPAIILIFAIFINAIFEKNKYIALIIISVYIFLGIITANKFFPMNRHVKFQSTQPSFRFIDQQKVVKKIIYLSNNKPFAIDVFTIPYFMPYSWEYLFWYQEKNKNKFNFDPTAKTIFVISQDDSGGKYFQEKWESEILDKGIVKSKFKEGILTVYELQLDSHEK